MSPTFSIITPSYNYEQFIDDALVSVARQRRVLAEHIVVDGASTDSTVGTLREADGIIWRSEPDDGQSDALNKAFALASGEIVGWLNADEYYLDDALYEVQRTFDTTGADVVYGDSIHVDGEGRLLRLAAQHRFDAEVLRHYGCYIPTCAFFVRRSALEDWSWDVQCRYIMDWDLYLWLHQNDAQFAYLPKPLGAFRVHSERVTAEPLPRDAPERIRVMRRYGISQAGTRRRAARFRRIALKVRSNSYLRQLKSRRHAGLPTRWW